jgi:hypothetical protein
MSESVSGIGISSWLLAPGFERGLQPSDVLALQRTAGNRAVSTLIGGHPAPKAARSPVVQRDWTLATAEQDVDLFSDSRGQKGAGQVGRGAYTAVDFEQAKDGRLAPAAVLPAGLWAKGADIGQKGYISAGTKVQTTMTLRDLVLERIGRSLRAAEARHPELLTGHLDKPKHREELMHPFRYGGVGEGLGGPADFANWFAWKNSVADQIAEGANYLADQLTYWRNAEFPKAPKVGFQEVDLLGSDLHERGLGAVHVKFTMPNADMKTDFVIKPEDRAAEAAMFGKGESSMARQLNELAGLGSSEAITTFLMKTHSQYGTLIEFCRGVQAKQLSGLEATSPALWETMALTMIAGLSDAHQENIFWLDKRPVFIDADNVLTFHRMHMASQERLKTQTGFTKYHEGATNAAYSHIQDVFTDPSKADPSKSKLLATLARDAKPVVDVLRGTFSGKSGRAVPVFTKRWGEQVYNASRWPLGQPTDPNSSYRSRWGMANGWLPKLETSDPNSQPEDGPGLAGETGIAAQGKFFDRSAEAQEIVTDLSRGRIPFYNYEFDTGHVIHNGRVIWHGHPLDEVLALLLMRFPKQG